MATRAKKRKQASENGVADTPVTGYRRVPRYREFKMPGAPEGTEPLTVSVQSNLPFGEKEDIALKGTFRDLYDRIAPYVVSWNFMAVNHATGQVEPVPPPAEGGPDALMVLDELEVLWLAGVVKTGHLPQTDEEYQSEKNAFGPSESGPDAVSSSDSDTT